jgi:hypothetical protein
MLILYLSKETILQPKLCKKATKIKRSYEVSPLNNYFIEEKTAGNLILCHAGSRTQLKP